MTGLKNAVIRSCHRFLAAMKIKQVIENGIFFQRAAANMISLLQEDDFAEQGQLRNGDFERVAASGRAGSRSSSRTPSVVVVETEDESTSVSQNIFKNKCFIYL